MGNNKSYACSHFFVADILLELIAIFNTFHKLIKKSFEENETEIVPYKFLLPSIISVQQVVEEKINLFNSKNRIK